jgi:hypothetical protein
MLWNLFGWKNKNEDTENEIKDDFELIDNNDLFILKNNESLVIIENFINKYFKTNKNINSFLKDYQKYLNQEIINNDFGDEKFNDVQQFLDAFLNIFKNDKYYSEKKFLNLIFFIIDKYQGLGWRELFKTIIIFLIVNDVKLDYSKIIHELTLISRYDTLLVFIGTQYQDQVYNTFKDILIKDRNNYLIQNNKEITYLAIWLHNEKNKLNKLYNFNYYLSYAISIENPNLYIKAVEKNKCRINKSIYLKILRKEFLSPLKKIVNDIKKKSELNNNQIIEGLKNNKENFQNYLMENL